MPRPRYQMTDDDVTVVHRWVRAKFRETGWPREGASLTAWDKFPLDPPTASCNGLQWKWLRIAINENLGPDYLHLSIPSGRD